MKKLIFSAFALVVFSFSTFAVGSVENKVVASDLVKFEQKKEVIKRSGEVSFTDKCGNEHDVTWSCAGNCTNEQIVVALNNWSSQNGCGGVVITSAVEN